MSKPTKYAMKAKTHSNKYSTAKGTVFLSRQDYQDLENKLSDIIRTIESITQCHYAGLPVKGKAVCSDEDKFNADVGMRIATLRAKMSGLRRLMRKINAAKKRLAAMDRELLSIQVDIADEEVNLQNQLDKVTL